MSDQKLLVCIDCGFICGDLEEYQNHECEEDEG
jgi:hypothetical protein